MDAQLKIKLSALDRLEGKLFYQGELFNGVAIEINNGLITSETQVVQGFPKGPYQCEYFPLFPDATRVEEHCPDLVGSKEYETTQQFRFRGVIFNGIYYEFQDECCIYMGSIVDGYADIELDWWTNGMLEEYAFWNKGSGADFQFSHNGKLQYIYQCKGDEHRLLVKFDEEERLKSLDLMGAYFDIQDELIDSLPFQFLTQANDLTNYVTAPEVLFHREGYNDALFQCMLEGGCFGATRTIRLIDAGLSAESVQALASIEHLQELRVLDRSGGLEEEMTRFAEQNPDIEIKYRRR